MATTTNYGWTTPDDTALVKDGASAIRTLGSSVDTTTKALNPSTTLGDIEYRSSTANTNTKLGIGTTGQALTVVGGVPAWAASPTSVLTTTGDTVYASAANTLSRLGIGSTGQVLTVAGGVPSWATAASGSLTSIATGSLSGASVSITSIPGTYKALKLIVNEYIPATDATALACQVNSDTASNYARSLAFGSTGGVISNTEMRLSSLVSNSSNPGYSETDFWNYTSTTQWKTVFSKNFMNSSTNQANINSPWNAWINTANAITSIQLFPVTGNFTSGSYILYGVN